tara:strand:- start:68 stop:739 length:672 start_codon:yes stop_codon:yes gene_type:complete
MNNPNKELFQSISKFIKSKKISNNIVDLGCGNGHLIKFLSKGFSEINFTGVDLYENNSINENLRFEKSKIQDFQSKKKYNLVLSIAVIEHIKDLEQFMKTISLLLEEEGYVIILTVNTNSFLYKISKLLYTLNFKSSFLRLYDPHHINHFSRESLVKLFHKFNFDKISDLKHPTKMKYIDYPYKNIFTKYVYYFSLSIIFFITDIIGWKHLQTVVFKKKLITK